MLPGFGAVGAELQAIVARAEVKDAGHVRVDGQSLADAAAIFVAAHFEFDGVDVPSFAAIGRTHHRGRIAAAHADGEVDDVWIDRIWGNAFGAEVTRFAQLVVERDPFADSARSSGRPLPCRSGGRPGLFQWG